MGNSQTKFKIENRKIINDFYQVPATKMADRLHKHIGVLLFKIQGYVQNCKGTGILISENIVLTAAHNIFNRQHITKYVDFMFYPGQFGELIEGYKVQGVWFPKQYQQITTPHPVKYDYAILKLASNVETNDFIPLKGNARFSSTLAIYGYPDCAYKQLQSNRSSEAVYQRGSICEKSVCFIRKEREQIIYCMQTKSGMSGSPLIELNNKELSIVGVHKGLHKRGITSKLNKKNIKTGFGRMMSASLIEELQIEVKKLNGSMFKTLSQQNRILINGKDQKYYYQQGLNFQNCENQQNAYKNYRMAIQINPNYFQALCSIGFLCYKLKLNDKAIKYLQRASHINWNCCELFNNLGFAYKQKNLMKQAIQCYQKAISLNPKNEAIINNLGRAYEDSDNLEQAIIHYKESLQINPQFYASLINLGNAYYKTNKMNEAIECYEKAIFINPNKETSFYNLATAYRSLNQIQKAIEYYKIAQSFNPSNNNIKKILSQLYPLCLNQTT